MYKGKRIKTCFDLSSFASSVNEAEIPEETASYGKEIIHSVLAFSIAML